MNGEAEEEKVDDPKMDVKAVVADDEEEKDGFSIGDIRTSPLLLNDEHLLPPLSLCPKATLQKKPVPTQEDDSPPLMKSKGK
jgi:hypothetical protein